MRLRLLQNNKYFIPLRKIKYDATCSVYDLLQRLLYTILKKAMTAPFMNV